MPLLYARAEAIGNMHVLVLRINHMLLHVLLLQQVLLRALLCCCYCAYLAYQAYQRWTNFKAAKCTPCRYQHVYATTHAYALYVNVCVVSSLLLSGCVHTTL
jgi:hypothetical protein